MFESDVMMPLMRASKVRASRTGFSWNREQLIYSLTRPCRLETETHVFIPMGSLKKPLASLLPVLETKRAPVHVVAFGGNTAFDRGTFHIVSVSKRFCILEKRWAAACKMSEVKGVSKKDVSHVEPVVVTGQDAAAQKVDDACFFEEAPKVHARKVQPIKATAGLDPLQTQVFARPITVVSTKPASSFSPAAPVPKSSYTSTTFPRAIRTVFSGVEYRSRLESRFAMLLSEFGIRYVYEPMKYNTKPGSTYTIDFFLPAQQLYVELKPKRPHIEEELKCEEMSKSGFRVTLMYGSSVFKLPFRSEYYKGRSHRDYAHHDALRGMTWIDGVKLAGDTVFVHGSCNTVLDAPGIHLNQVVSAASDTRWSHEHITAGFKALQRRFPYSPPSCTA